MRIAWVEEKFKEILSILEYGDESDYGAEVRNEAKRRVANLRDQLVNELKHKDPGRMTNAQRDKLWEMCGRYGVKFKEEDYFVGIDGMAEGWVGGYYHNGEPAQISQFKKTIYVGVEPNGDSHT